jgi:hypothetical protein
MDFSKLSASEKMAVYAAVAVVILAIYSLAYRWGGLMALPLIGGLGVLAVIFLPQMSNTSLPGSRGSLLLIAGGGAALFWALNTLVWLGYIFDNLNEIDTWIYLVGFAAALWLGWQCWQAFQSEGGAFRLGSSGTATASAAPAAPAAPAAAPEAAAAPAPAAETPPPAPEAVDTGSPMAAETDMDEDDETRPPTG